jgi:exodeoxyribonuclease V alpha subunit
MHKGTLGTDNLNRELRELLNLGGKAVKGDRFRVGDRVMQVRNNYEKEVFNGDVGRIIAYDSEWDEAVVDFDGREVRYHVSELDELILAYAVTIHKAQGSEYPAVIVPLSTQHYVLLRRNLLYTAMTRGRKLVILLGSPKALQMAVENRIVEPRFTYLAQKLGKGL